MNNQDFQNDMNDKFIELKKLTDSGKNILAWTEVINIDSDIDGEPGHYVVVFRTLELSKHPTEEEAIKKLTKALAERKSDKLIRHYFQNHQLQEYRSKKKNGGKLYICLAYRKPTSL